MKTRILKQKAPNVLELISTFPTLLFPPANGFHNPPFSPPVYQTKDFTCDMNHLKNGTKNHSVGGRQKTIPLPISHMLKEKARNMFTRKMLHKKVPICQWLPEYNSSTAVSDLVAGVTVGLTVIPQAIAYSNVAGLPPQVSSCYRSFQQS